MKTNITSSRLGLVVGATILAAGLSACDRKEGTHEPAPTVAASPTVSGGAAVADAQAEGHREGMDMERDAHERGMKMGSDSHASGMAAGGNAPMKDDAMPMKKADPMPMNKSDPKMKMDDHM
jgi:hypothetical protein